MLLFTLQGAEAFGLLLVRCISFFIAGPIFAQRGIPAHIKIMLGAACTLLLWPLVPSADLPAAGSLIAFLIAVAGETFLGILLGLAAALPFAGLRMAGSLVGVQMGFGIVNVWSPQDEGQVSIIGGFYGILALILFLVLDGHHLLLRAMGMSLKVVPLGGALFSAPLLAQIVGMAGSLFVVAVAVGGPLIAVLFLADAAMGFVARTVPQMNIFIVGFPVKIGLGLLGIAVTLPFFNRTVGHLISGIEHDLLLLLAGM
ncbi:MAG: flagellar biosynthetic protein FliR [Candidatus Eisenbacteria sp.]|nr:flagellar biosynthetic protein FliR [Candidatus Eisenbacteria bacterium]